MAHRCLALLGTEEGPWVSLHGKGRPYIRISGLPEGACIYVQYDGLHEIFSADGEYSIGALADWYRVKCHQPDRGTICELFMKAA